MTTRPPRAVFSMPAARPRGLPDDSMVTSGCTVRSAALSGRGVQIYGDGLQRRDFVHVADVVTAVQSAWDRRFTGTAIVGCGQSVTVLELLDLVRTVTGRPLPAEHVAAKPGEMPAVIVDISRAREQLGYRPSVSLVDGLATVWNDFSAAAATTAGGPQR